MEVIRETKKGVEILRLAGNLIFSELPQAKDVIVPVMDNPAVSKILINLKQISFLDSSGIGFIVGRVKTAKQRQITLALCECSPTVMDILKTTHLDRILLIFKTEADALANL